MYSIQQWRRSHLPMSLTSHLLNTSAKLSLAPKSLIFSSSSSSHFAPNPFLRIPGIPRAFSPLTTARVSLSSNAAKTTMGDTPDAGMDAVQRRLMFEDECVSSFLKIPFKVLFFICLDWSFHMLCLVAWKDGGFWRRNWILGFCFIHFLFFVFFSTDLFVLSFAAEKTEEQKRSLLYGFNFFFYLVCLVAEKMKSWVESRSIYYFFSPFILPCYEAMKTMLHGLLLSFYLIIWLVRRK